MFALVCVYNILGWQKEILQVFWPGCTSRAYTGSEDRNFKISLQDILRWTFSESSTFYVEFYLRTQDSLWMNSWCKSDLALSIQTRDLFDPETPYKQEGSESQWISSKHDYYLIIKTSSLLHHLIFPKR